MCEQLREKMRTLPEQPYDFDFFNFDNVKSAVEGLIKYHENSIERIIETTHYTEMEEIWAMAMIKHHIEEMQVIEYWMEDAI